MNESNIQKSIQQWVIGKGGYCIKLHGNAFTKSGEPDLIGGFYVPNVVGSDYLTYLTRLPFVVETKMPGKQPRRLQEVKLQLWADAGFAPFVVSSLTEFIDRLGDYVDVSTL